jgi:hypothetical protein
MATATTTRNYKLGPVKPWVQSAANELGNMFDFANIGGWRAVGSVPNSDHPKGLALDFMTFDKTKANSLIDFAIANADRLGITYIIYYRRIWEKSTGTWKAYSGPNPHVDHVHISFSANGGDSSAAATDGTIQPVGLTDPSSWPVIKQIEGLSKKLQDGAFWTRIGMYFLGGILILVGILFLIRKPAEQAATAAAKVVI